MSQFPQFEEVNHNENFTSFLGVLLKFSKDNNGKEKENPDSTSKVEPPLLTPEAQPTNSLFQYDNCKNNPSFIPEESNQSTFKLIHENPVELNCDSLNSSYFDQESLINQVCSSLLLQNHDPNSIKSIDELGIKHNSNSQFNLISSSQHTDRPIHEVLGFQESLDENLRPKLQISPLKSPKESFKKYSEDSIPFFDLLKSPSYFVSNSDLQATLHSDNSLFGFDVAKGQPILSDPINEENDGKPSEAFALKDLDGSVLLEVNSNSNNTSSGISNSDNSFGEEDIQLVIELDEKLSIRKGRKKRFATGAESQDEVDVTLQDPDFTLTSENVNTFDCCLSSASEESKLVQKNAFHACNKKQIPDNNLSQNCVEASQNLRPVSCGSSLSPLKHIKETESRELETSEEDDHLYEVVDSYRCKSCFEVFNNKQSIVKHYNEIHQTAKQPVLIRVSTKQVQRSVFSISPTSLEPSPKCIILKDVALLRCESCNKELIEESLYLSHVKDCHTEGDSAIAWKKFKGKRCGKDDIESGPVNKFGRKKFKKAEHESSLCKNEDKAVFGTAKRPFPLLKDFCQRNLRCGLFGCAHRFSTPANLKLHQSCHDFHSYSKTSFSCSECQAPFSKWSECSLHLWRSHGVDVDLLQCDVCLSFKATNVHQMSVHQETHSEGKPYVCRHCESSFRQLSQLNNHERTHDSQGERSLSAWKQRTLCNICNKWYSSYHSYLQHYQSIHVALKKFSCPECDYKCDKKSRMTEHARKHSGRKSYWCELCDFSCVDHNTVRRHRLKHLTKKHLKCPSEKCSLETVHVPFFRKHHRAKHLHQKMQYPCQICPLVSNDIESYIKHCSKHEKEIISELIRNAKETGKPLSRGTPCG